MTRSVWSHLLAFAAGVTISGALHLMLGGVIRDEYQLADSPLLDWAWFPFLAGVTLAAVAAAGLIATRRR